MLEPIVEQVHCGVELRLGQLTGGIAIGAHQHGHAWQGPRQQQRFVARVRHVGEDAGAVGDHRDAGTRPLPGVAAAEDCRTLTALEEQAGEAHDRRRLPGAADAHVADADDRLLQVTAARGTGGIPSAPPRRCGAIHRAERLHDH